MKKTIASLLLLFVTASCTNNSVESIKPAEQAWSAKEVVVYKNPNCGCCTKWSEHMKKNGFKLTEKSVDNLSEIKDGLKVPTDKRSCHTAVIDGYVFEGHIPASSIKKFLNEKNDAVGLVVPGMPAGSPGMEFGNHTSNFHVYSFDASGKTKVFEKF